jgi:hypothetical protein
MLSAVSNIPRRCVTSDEAWSGAAALAIVSALHGVPLEVRELAALTFAGDLARVEEGTVLVMARAMGFEAVAMEGGYGDLPDVTLPLLVALREGEHERYAVLFAFDDERATVGDPATGEVTPWPRERFCALWTGSVVQVTPVDAERRAFAARLADERDPVKRALRLVGWVAPYPPRVAMLAGLALVAVAAALAPSSGALDVAWVALVGAACAGALWSWLGAGSCARCSRARQLAAGLPLAPAGALLYAALLASRFAAAPAIAVTVALGAAVGVHAALVATLARSKLSCPPCLFVAACALGSAAVWVLRGGVHPELLVVAAAVTCGAVLALLPAMRVREARTWRSEAESIARAASAEPRAEPPVRVRVIAFKRPGCSACAFFEAAVKPAILAGIDESVALEERDLGRAQTVAPLIVVLGARQTLFVGLPAESAPARILDAVREALDGQPNDAPMTVYVAE